MRLLVLALFLASPLAAAQGAGLTPALPDTVRTDAVDGDNGVAILRETGEPFTGIVADTYPSGAKKLRRSVVDGKPEGLWVEWYESGVPRYLATWADGRGEGTWTYFHETGEVRERATVVGDVYAGPVEGWHANGRKAFEGTLVDNERDGTWRFWAEDGALDRVEQYEAGALVE